MATGALANSAPLSQTRRMKSFAFVFMAICLFLVSGCSSPTTVATKQISLSGLGTISVLPFDGYNGEQFSNEVAQQLMLKGARLVDRARLDAVLVEKGLSAASITQGVVDITKLGGLLGVDVVVTGSVSPIVVYVSGAPSGKVSTASLRFISVKTGEILGAASYSANTELLAGSVLYPEAARRLVNQISAN